MAQMECIVCAKTFHRRGYVMKTPLCSKECRRKSKFRKCEQCNAEYTVYGPGDNKKYCSHECYLKTVEDRPKVEHINPCGYCGRLINKKLRRSKKNVFCSQECNSSYRNPPKTVLCTDCFGRKGDCKCVAFKKSLWGKMIAKQRSMASSRAAYYRNRTENEWDTKIGNVISGLYNRYRATKSKLKRENTYGSWTGLIQGEMTRAKNIARRRTKHLNDPWARKCATVWTNWRRKAIGRQGTKPKGVEGITRKTKVQVCFDWDTIETRNNSTRPHKTVQRV